MNRLQHESSPYLLQHADNPVDWYPWSDEALAKAKAENKPILVSVGYSTCHWCHVMARESFEKEPVAAFMNEHFINIKIDREERPDLDQVYMEVCQAITGSGGWPLNCFLLPDGRPFYAGTYFPPLSHHNRPSWMELLQRVHNLYHQKQEVVEDQASKLLLMLQQSESAVIEPLADLAKPGEAEETLEKIRSLRDQLYQNRDKEHGGFGGAPKFPQTMSLRWLLDHHLLRNDPDALEHLDHSLEHMIRGGIYDQLGGGFARYATDRQWLVPHFEKMLYDNALLLGLLADRCRYHNKEEYFDIIEQTIEWVEREMQHPEQGFYSALDADSEGKEGTFYIWSQEEIERILGEEAALFIDYYDVSEAGNWEGHNILWRPYSLEAFAKKHSLSAKKVAASLEHSRQKLLQAREKRGRPGLDDKQLLGWNALMIGAYAKCAIALENQLYLDRAQQKMAFILDSFKRAEGGYVHAWKDGPSDHEAFLDDYALLIEAMINLYEATFDTDWLRKAADVTDYVRQHFLDEHTNLFYFTTVEQTETPIRKKDFYDSAMPSGNATMCQNLMELGRYFDRSEYREQSRIMIASLEKATLRFPSSFARWGRCLLMQTLPGPEIVIVGRDWMRAGAELRYAYRPGSLLMTHRTGSESFPLFEGRDQDDESTRIYICQNYTCQRPVGSVTEAEKQLAELALQ